MKSHDKNISLKNTREKFVILYYDRPILSIQSDKAGKDYLHMLVEDTQTSDKWFIIELTDELLANLKNDRISLYDAFRNNPSGRIIQVIVAYKDNQILEKFDWLETRDISDQDLPKKDLFIGVYLRKYSNNKYCESDSRSR